ELEINIEPFPPKRMRQQMLRVQARIIDPAFCEVSGRGLKNVEHGHTLHTANGVIPSHVEASRCAISKVTPRDPFTSLRSPRDDISWSARCLSVARSDPQLAVLKSFPRGRLP